MITDNNISELREKLQEIWEQRIQKHKACDISISPLAAYFLQSWCNNKKYICKFYKENEKKYIFTIATNEEELKKHEENR